MPEKPSPPSPPEGDFYADIAQQYEVEVARFVPGYIEEIVPLVTNEVTQRARHGAVLDIGSGVGNIAKRIIDEAECISVDLVEISSSMIEESKRRLRGTNTTLKFHNLPAQNFKAEPNSFDAVLSNLVIHNIPIAEKAELIKNIFRWLKKSGVFVWTDLVSFSDSDELEKCFTARKEIALTLGATEEFAEENFKKERERDHMITIDNMIELLKQAGFINPEILWVKYNEVVIRATK